MAALKSAFNVLGKRFKFTECSFAMDTWMCRTAIKAANYNVQVRSNEVLHHESNALNLNLFFYFFLRLFCIKADNFRKKNYICHHKTDAEIKRAHYSNKIKSQLNQSNEAGVEFSTRWQAVYNSNSIRFVVCYKWKKKKKKSTSIVCKLYKATSSLFWF